MDYILSLLTLTIFVTGILIVAFWSKAGLLDSAAKLLRQATEARWTLRQFLSMNLNRPRSKEKFLFTEEAVVSVGYRYNGRFDAAVLHWEEVPVLDAIIERKFPVNHIPWEPRPEDFFQAGLYALAMMEKGVSCSATRLILVYCTQSNARLCGQRNEAKCITCSQGRTFQTRFRPKPLIRLLRKFDEYWYRNRAPVASPNSAKCRACRYGIDHSCNYSAL